MLYLLRSFGRNGITILNIGYAKDFKKELARYQDEYNPGAQEVNHRPGDEVDETILHLYLHDLGYNEFMDNWYCDCQDVINIFNLDQRRIDEEVWKKRNKIFSEDKLKDHKVAEAYSKLLKSIP